MLAGSQLVRALLEGLNSFSRHGGSVLVLACGIDLRERCFLRLLASPVSDPYLGGNPSVAGTPACLCKRRPPHLEALGCATGLSGSLTPHKGRGEQAKALRGTGVVFLRCVVVQTVSVTWRGCYREEKSCWGSYTVCNTFCQCFSIQRFLRKQVFTFFMGDSVFFCVPCMFF